MKILLSFLLTFFSCCANLWASSERMIFWYPGEAGSQTEAQPLLEVFAQVTSKQSGKALEVIYFNDETSGEKYVASKKPLLGILSYPLWQKWKQKHPESTVLLQVVPTHGKLMEQYLLVGKSPPKSMITIYSSEPLSSDFVQTELFPDNKWQVNITSQTQLLFKLKELAEGKWQGYCLLTPREAQSFQALKSSWKQHLSFTQASKPIPTPRLVLFDKNKLAQAADWKNTFLNLSSQAEAQEILAELNLRGFAK